MEGFNLHMRRSRSPAIETRYRRAQLVAAARRAALDKRHLPEVRAKRRVRQADGRRAPALAHTLATAANAATFASASATSSSALSNQSNVAACFFGSPRALELTHTSLVANTIYPISGAGAEVVVFVHAMLAEPLNAVSSALLAALPRRVCPRCSRDEIALRMVAVEQAVVDGIWNIPEATQLTVALARKQSRRDGKVAGRCFARWRWKYSDSTISNVYRSRFSSREAFALAVAYEARVGGQPFTHVLLARLDTIIASRISWPPVPGAVSVPSMQHSWGINDRFAYGERGPIAAYLQQFDRMLVSASGRATAYADAKNFESELLLYRPLC